MVLTIVIWSLAVPDRLGSGELITLRRFLPAAGLEVHDAGAPPTDGGAFLLLVDRRTADQEEELLSWVDAGGRLIVTDPGSQLFDRFGVTSERAAVFGTTRLGPGCVRGETLGVGALEIAATDRVLATRGVATGCFPRGARSFALFLPRGRGEIVLTGGPSFLTDVLLNHADNAVFARALLDAGGPVVLGPSVPPSTARHSVWALLPTGAKSALWVLVLAALVFALARGRRLGRPVPEALISPIPAGELVSATARLYRRARVAAYCGELVRTWTGERVARRVGIPYDPDRRRLAATISNVTGLERDGIERALDGPEPRNDAELVALCRELEAMARRIEGAKR